MASHHRSKRVKSLDASSVVAELPRLCRSQLEAVAKAAVESSSEAAKAAAIVLNQSNKSLKHCVRCHCDFDPEVAGAYDCVMEEHDENNGMIESGGSGFEWLWPCCEKNEDSGEPCWIGRHIVSWGQGGDGYWKDEELAGEWSRRSEGECFECKHAQGWCTTCCTCGQAGDEDE